MKLGQKIKGNRLDYYLRRCTEDVTGCLVYNGSITRSGYAVANIHGKVTYLHKLIYEKTYGKVISGNRVDHMCNKTNCLNIKHLRELSHAANISRHGTNGRRRKWSLLEANDLYNSGYTQGEIAEKFGVDPASISKGLKHLGEVSSNTTTIRG